MFIASPPSISEQSSTTAAIGLVDSKHNQTLWSLSGVELKAYRAEFLGGDLQLPSSCECSLCWNFSISSLHPKLPPSKADQQQQHSRPCHPCTTGGPSQLRNIPGFVWEKICVYTNHRCSEFFLISEGGGEGTQGKTQFPLGNVCQNYLVDQLSPNLIKR